MTEPYDALAEASQKISHAFEREKDRYVELQIINLALIAALEGVLLNCQVAAPGPHWRWDDEYYEAFNKAREALAVAQGG